MVTVKLAVPPTGIEEIAGHLTLPPLTVPPPDALTKVAFTGRASETTTLLALVGPRFVTETWQVNAAPGLAVGGPLTAAMRSAEGANTVSPALALVTDPAEFVTTTE
jgi:hypothetical protein